MRIGWAPLEIECLIPRARFVIFGMDEQGSNARNVRCLGGAEECVLEQRLAEPTSLLSLVDRQSGQKHDWDGMTRKPLADAGGRLRMFNGADGEAVVADDSPFAATDDIGLSAAGPLVGERVAF